MYAGNSRRCASVQIQPETLFVYRSATQELSHLTNSFAQLKTAEGKFKGCIESVKEVKKENKRASDLSLHAYRCGELTTRTPAKTILVPLTNSLYVPGKLSDAENVIVDVGTGYYVKKVCPFNASFLKTAY
jgi:prefoldin alpha subunit